MNNYHIPLICVEGLVTEAYGSPLSPGVELGDFVSNDPNVSIDDNGGEAYPELVFTGFESAPVIVLAGLTLTAEIIGGIHPPYRPR